MNTLDRTRYYIRTRLEEGVDVSEIRTHLIARYGSFLPAIALMAYDRSDQVDSLLHTTARQWVRSNTAIVKD